MLIKHIVQSISSLNTLCNSLKVINKSSERKCFRFVLFVQSIFVILASHILTYLPILTLLRLRGDWNPTKNLKD